MVDTRTVTCPAEAVRFEVLPFPRSLEEAAQLPEKVRLTVTCSPKHGPDRSVEVAAQLRELGHQVTVHVAARMVRDRAHLDAILGAMADAGADDLFLIGGDADPPQGEYASAVALIDVVATHPRRPRTDRYRRISGGPPRDLRYGAAAGTGAQEPIRRLCDDADVL